MERTTSLAGIGLGDPAGDSGGVGAAVEGAAVLGESVARIVKPFTRAVRDCVVLRVGVDVDNQLGGLVGSFGSEGFCEPEVERVDERVFAEVDVGGVVIDRDPGASAAVVATAAALALAGHPPLACRAEHAPAQQVGDLGGPRRAYLRGCHCLYASPVVPVDEGVVGGFG